MAWLYNARKVPALLAVAEAAFSVPQVGFSSQALQRSILCMWPGRLEQRGPPAPISFQNVLFFVSSFRGM